MGECTSEGFRQAEDQAVVHVVDAIEHAIYNFAHTGVMPSRGQINSIVRDIVHASAMHKARMLAAAREEAGLQ